MLRLFRVRIADRSTDLTLWPVTLTLCQPIPRLCQVISTLFPLKSAEKVVKYADAELKSVKKVEK